jgi:tRNA G46 methylase TrmB
MATIEASQVGSKQSAYDVVPYPSYPFPQTHPDRLATIATLFGMKPAPVEHCRVLELGCASGGNLIPMAATLPESTFVGIDRSRKQVAQGQVTIDALDLRNIEQRQLDLDADLAAGRFFLRDIRQAVSVDGNPLGTLKWRTRQKPSGW